MAPVTVQTVLGPVETTDLGPTLTHDHVLLDVSSSWKVEPGNARAQALVDRKLASDIIGDLRYSPLACRDNLRIDDEKVAGDELRRFVEAGGRTLLDPTCRGMGRNHEALARIAETSGANIVLGTGYYLASAHPPEVAAMSSDDVAEVIVSDVRDGIDGSGIRSGFIGEIGISENLLEAEEKVLRGAARAQLATKVPLSVHLPGWHRLGHRVLDIAEEEGVDPRAIVLCHMNPAHADLAYLVSLARRGAWLGWDMIGMDMYYGAHGMECPSDEDAARAIVFLASAGYAAQVLLSSDVYLKMMLVRYGGFGYAHVLEHFVPRLHRQGLDESHTQQMLQTNPQHLFEQTAA